MKTFHTFSQIISEQALVQYDKEYKGEDFKRVQQKLIDLGFLKISNPTGYFGNLTKAAIEDFQKRNNLPINGSKLDSTTYQKLMSVTTKFVPTSITAAPIKKEIKPPVDSSKTASFSQPVFPPPAKSDSLSQYEIKPAQLDYALKKQLAAAGIPEKDFEQGSWWQRFVKKSMKSIPLHIRAMLYYIAGRTSEMKEDELTPEERNYLYSIAKKHGLQNGLKYGMWKSAGASDLPTAITQQGITAETEKLAKTKAQQITDMLVPNIAGQFMYTLGEVDKTNVKQVAPTSIQIVDNYDMNAVGKSKEEVIKAVADTFELYTQGKAGLYSLIRQAISLRELAGYAGFPVKLTVNEPTA